MALTLKIINEELAKRGHTARLGKGTGYFYFYGGEAAEWLDETVRVATLNNLTLEEWLASFERLRKLNVEIMERSRGITTESSVRFSRAAI